MGKVKLTNDFVWDRFVDPNVCGFFEFSGLAMPLFTYHAGVIHGGLMVNGIFVAMYGGE